MLDYFAFRDLARATFPSLIVSTMMYEKGSGAGGEVTMYRVKVSGQGIGEALATDGLDGQLVLDEMVRLVGISRGTVQRARHAYLDNRRVIVERPLRRAA